MKKIFTGLLFIFLDFNLTINAHVIGLLPDFVGYIMVMNGLSEMLSESPRFEKIKPWALGMTIYTAILYVLALLGFAQAAENLLGLFEIIAGIISLYITYNLVMAVKDMEEKYSYSLQGESLRKVWIYLAAIEGIGYFSNLWGYIFIGDTRLILISMGSAGFILAVAGFITIICFLVFFNKSKNLYYTMKQ